MVLLLLLYLTSYDRSHNTSTISALEAMGMVFAVVDSDP